MGYQPRYLPPQKDAGIAALLALIPGFFLIMGLGHIYVGRLAKGIGILILGILLIPLLLLFFVPLAFGIAFLGSAPGPGSVLTGFATLIIVVLVFLASYLGLLIWQTIDAYNLANLYNAAVARTGAAPW
jgi:TM2 domain-containing membrane protein YozV